MNFTFTEAIPQNDKIKIRVISGDDSLQFNGKEYLVAEDEQKVIFIFEIRHEYHCSPFKEAMLIDHILAVGHEEHFYLYDISSNRNFYKLKTDGYFGHLYFNDDLFYVTDASGIHCIDKTGLVAWQNTSLAFDGVLINNFEAGKIYGSAELDPPGGWQDFILDLATGNKIS